MKRREKDGVERVKVSYPKFKNGEATVRDVRVEPNFGKHLDLQMRTWNFCFEKSEKVLFLPSFCFYFRVCWGDISDVCECEDELKDANTELYEKTPAAMNTMLEKQPRAEALLKRQQRSITAVHSTNL